MRPQTVEIALFDKETHEFYKPHEYTFVAKHKYGWVRKLQVRMFNWLVKCGALSNTIGYETEYTAVRLDSGDPNIKNIHRVIDHLQCAGHEPGHLYMGPEAAQEMIHGMEPEYRHYLEMARGSRPAEIMGIPWSIVPWMKGWVIVPEKQ